LYRGKKRRTETNPKLSGKDDEFETWRGQVEGEGYTGGKGKGGSIQVTLHKVPLKPPKEWKDRKAQSTVHDRVCLPLESHGEEGASPSKTDAGGPFMGEERQ